MWNGGGLHVEDHRRFAFYDLSRNSFVDCLAIDYLAKALNDHCHTLATTDAHGLHAVGLVFPLKTIDEGCHDACTGHAEWVTKRNSTTVDVELVHWNSEVLC